MKEIITRNNVFSMDTANHLSNQQQTAFLSTKSRHQITTCNRNYSKEGIYHPDRILEEYDLLYLLQGS